MCGSKAVRSTRIVNFLCATDESSRLHCRVLDGNDLVIIAVHDQSRDIDLLKVLGEISLREGPDAFIRVFEANFSVAVKLDLPMLILIKL